MYHSHRRLHKTLSTESRVKNIPAKLVRARPRNQSRGKRPRRCAISPQQFLTCRPRYLHHRDRGQRPVTSPPVSRQCRVALQGPAWERHEHSVPVNPCILATLQHARP